MIKPRWLQVLAGHRLVVRSAVMAVDPSDPAREKPSSALHLPRFVPVPALEPGQRLRVGL